MYRILSYHCRIKNGIRFECAKRTIKILGIETSCDDTGCAIVDDNGNILGESLQSQQEIHLEHGGIIPPVARDLHKAAIQDVVKKTLQNANLQLNDIDAIATTMKPGLPLSLLIGMQYGKHLSKTYKKPFIPIHHMEAHALTVRMVEKVEFPFLVLLISGGHSLLAVAQSATHFQLLGQSLDDAPGEAMDKASRRLKLRNILDYREMSGGRAVEKAAAGGDPSVYDFSIPMFRCRDCNFSFSAYKNAIFRIVRREEEQYEIAGGQTLPLTVLQNICAGLQHGIATHICHRTQRAMEYCQQKNLIDSTRKTLVVSGGVACNQYIKKALGLLCDQSNYELQVPPPRLCTDNGIMIAWNGIERWKANEGVFQHDNIDHLDIQSKCPLGESLIEDLKSCDIKCKYVKLNALYHKDTSESSLTETEDVLHNR